MVFKHTMIVIKHKQDTILMKTSLRKNTRGIAHLMAIIIVVVILAVGAAGYYVYNKNKNNNPNLAGKTTAEKTAIKEAETECSKVYNDKDFCKFASTFTGKGPYKMSFVSTDKTGKASTMIIEIDAKENSSVITKEGATETAAFITLNGDTYMKNEADGSWLKTPKSTDTAAAEKPTSNIAFDAKKELAKPADQRTTIKKLGKEQCGSSNCIKYSFVDPTEKTMTDGLLWIGDKDFQLHKMSYKDADGNTLVAEFTYTAVTINVPSPVKEIYATPSAADIQAIEQAISAGGTQE